MFIPEIFQDISILQTPSTFQGKTEFPSFPDIVNNASIEIIGRPMFKYMCIYKRTSIDKLTYRINLIADINRQHRYSISNNLTWHVLIITALQHRDKKALKKVGYAYLTKNEQISYVYSLS